VTPQELRAIPLFEGLSDTGLERLMASAGEIECEPGQVLVLRGEPGSGMYVVLDGTVTVELRGGLHTDLGVGNFFGETALLVPSAVRGARVRAVSLEEMAEIYPVRAALEEVAAREAARRLDAAADASLAAEVEGMRAAAVEGDLHRQVEHDVRFHRLIVEASGNRTLLEVWTSLGIEARTIMTLLKTGLDPAELAEMHQPILDALRSGDPDLAGRTVRSHVESFRDLLLEGAPA